MRRRMFGALIAVSATALATLTSLSQARAEMVYRIATMGEPKTLDPHGVSGIWENYVVGDMFMGLLTDAADATPIPGAAESWTISDDGLTYTFKIRDHTWSDGVPVTADDFVYSFQRILDPKLAAEYASLLYPIKNAEAFNTGKITDPSQLGVKAIDPKTLQFTLEGPTGYFLELLTHYTAWPVPKHAIEKFGAGLGQARQHRRQWCVHGHRVDAERADRRRQESQILRRRQRQARQGHLLPGRGPQCGDQALSRRRDRPGRRLRLRADRLPQARAAEGDADRALSRHLLLCRRTRSGSRSTILGCAGRCRLAIERNAITDKVLKTGRGAGIRRRAAGYRRLGRIGYQPEWVGNDVSRARRRGQVAAGAGRLSVPTTRSSSSCPTTPARTTSGSPSRSSRCGSSWASRPSW